MTLDYHIRSREIDVNDTAAEELPNLNGDAESKNQSIGVRFTFSLPRLSLCSFSLSRYHFKISPKKIRVLIG